MTIDSELKCDDFKLSRHARACRGHPRLKMRVSKSWMAGTSPAMTMDDELTMRSARIVLRAGDIAGQQDEAARRIAQREQERLVHRHLGEIRGDGAGGRDGGRRGGFGPGLVDTDLGAL